MPSSRLSVLPEGLFRLAAESLPTGVLVADPAGVIVWANQQIERQFGYARAELVGHSVETLLPEGLREVHAAHRGGFHMKPQARPMGAGRDLRGRRRDGSTFPVEVGLNPIESPDGVFVVAAVVDISARYELERAARHSVERKLEFERLIAELSFQFLNLPPDQIIDATRNVLSRMGVTLEVDRCSFYRIGDGEALVPIGAWNRDGVAPPPVVMAAKERFPWALETILAGRLVCFSRLADVPNPVDRESYQLVGTVSAVTVPLSVRGKTVGAVGFNMTARERAWEPETLHTMRAIASLFCGVLARYENDNGLRQAISKVERLRDQLQAENRYLLREVQERAGSSVIIGQSPGLRRVLEQAEQVAATDSTVLLLGETGTGKELVANYIHERSARRGRIMVRVNCSAIPGTLMESELFGREKGAFTGALARQIGRFELADHSTIFLDEIGDLPPDVQVKLLRVLEERQIERLGSPKSIHVDVRIIAATHRNLEKRITDETFREDLFYRLSVFPITIPPLRERSEDIPLLAWRFVEEFSRSFGKRIDAIPREDIAALQRYGWPGNIRQLRNAVERAMIVATSPELRIPVPASSAPSSGKRHTRLIDVEKDHIRTVVESTGWRVRGPEGAAARLGLKPTTLETRMAKLGLKRPEK